MKFGYADPPYLGRCSYYGHNHGDDTHPFDGGCWNDIATHAALVRWLDGEHPDGWALSLSAPSLFEIVPFCPTGTRVGAWVKPFASFKPGINPGYCWEPVLFRGGRKRERMEDTVRDFVSANIVLKKGFVGAKPPAFCEWVLDLLGVRPGDVLVDVFPGSGVMSSVARERTAQEAA